MSIKLSVIATARALQVNSSLSSIWHKGCVWLAWLTRKVGRPIVLC